MLKKHKQNCGGDDITTIKTSNESHLHWKKHFHKYQLFFRIYTDFEADNGKNTSNMGNKTTNIFKQNPVLNGFVLSINTKDIFKDLKNLEDLFDFSNLDENQEIFSNENKK